MKRKKYANELVRKLHEIAISDPLLDLAREFQHLTTEQFIEMLKDVGGSQLTNNLINAFRDLKNGNVDDRKNKIHIIS